MHRADRRRLLRCACAACAILSGSVSVTLPGSVARAQPLARTREPQAAWHDGALAAFSSALPGAPVPGGWSERELGGIARNRFSLVSDGGVTVLRIDSQSSASSLIHPVSGVAARARRVRWSWWVDAYPARDALGEKRGDDFAARVYLLFDYPLERVPTAQRWLLRLANVLHGDEVPAASICYVLDPRAPTGTMFASPYTERVRMIVVRSTRELGRWWSEERDVAQDFARAFGAEHGPGVAPIRAIVVASDTDQSGARVQARFGDVAVAGA
ncbi:MAG: DUF3047 domain-containing protein [Burkholderiaceae bacterium]|nr:DUF3047 domain-containing protein [Burkholderiaceae bacterium]